MNKQYWLLYKRRATYLIGSNLRYVFGWKNGCLGRFLTASNVIASLHCNCKQIWSYFWKFRIASVIFTFNFVRSVIIATISIDSSHEKTSGTRMFDDLRLVFRLFRHIGIDTGQSAPKHFVISAWSVLLLADKRCPSDGQIARLSTATTNVRWWLVNTVGARVVLRWRNRRRPVAQRIGSRDSELVSRIGRDGIDQLGFLPRSESIHFFGRDIYGKNTPSLIPIGPAFHHVHSDRIAICSAVSPSENSWWRCQLQNLRKSTS